MRLGEFSWLLEGMYGAASAMALALPSMMAAMGEMRIGGATPTVEPLLEEELRARERQQAAVADLGRRGFETTDLPLLMQEATALVAETLGVEYAKVLELLPGGGVLLMRAGVGWREGLVGRVTVGADVDSQAGFTLLCREPVIVEDLAREDRFSSSALLRDHGVVSGLSVLIQGDGRPYGVLEAHSSERRVFTRDDVHFLQAVANVLGAAIQRQQADETLHQREESYRSLYLAVSGGIVVQNRDGVIIEANETACDILGLTRREIQGRTSNDPRWRTIRADGSVFPGEEHPAMVTLRTGRPVRDVVMGVLHLRTGEYRWILVNSEPIIDQTSGGVHAVVATFADITEQKRAAEAQQFLAEAGKALASSLDYETTLASITRLAVPRISDWCSIDMLAEDGAVRRLAVAHVDPSRVQTGHEMHRRFPPDPNAPHGLPKVLKTGSPEIYPEVPDSLLEAMAQNAEHLEILRQMGFRSVMVVPLVARGRILGAVQFVSGESGRLFGSADLAMAEGLAHLAALAVDNARLYRQAQRAIRVRDDFLSVAAHELRTPVTSLQGFAQLAMRELSNGDAPDPGRMHQALQVIDYQSKKLSRLVSQLLDVSRMEAERLLVERQMVDLTQLVKRVVAAASTTTNGHTLLVRAPAILPAVVDPIRVEQVVTNLVDNAIKYSPNGGEVEIDLSMPCPQTVRLAVRDHGIGIPPEQRDRIFDRLYRAHPVKHFSGLGLGLYLVREIVGLHGGVIEVDSPPDGGTLFVVTLSRGLDLPMPNEAEAA